MTNVSLPSVAFLPEEFSLRNLRDTSNPIVEFCSRVDRVSDGRAARRWFGSSLDERVYSHEPVFNDKKTNFGKEKVCLCLPDAHNSRHLSDGDSGLVASVVFELLDFARGEILLDLLFDLLADSFLNTTNSVQRIHRGNLYQSFDVFDRFDFVLDFADRSGSFSIGIGFVNHPRDILLVFSQF